MRVSSVWEETLMVETIRLTCSSPIEGCFTKDFSESLKTKLVVHSRSLIQTSDYKKDWYTIGNKSISTVCGASLQLLQSSENTLVY